MKKDLPDNPKNVLFDDKMAKPYQVRDVKKAIAKKEADNGNQE